MLNLSYPKWQKAPRMQPPEPSDEPGPPTEEDRRISRKTALDWYNGLKKGTVPPGAEESMRDCMDKAGVDLKGLLGSDLDNETLEKELRVSIRNIHKRMARDDFERIIARTLPAPELIERKMREHMKEAGIKNLRQLLASREDNETLEARLSDAMKTHQPRINLEAARRLYKEIISMDGEPLDLQAQVKRIDRHLALAQEADPAGKYLLDEKERLSSAEMLDPYRLAKNNHNLGHARRIYADVLNGRVEVQHIESHIADMEAQLKMAKAADNNLVHGLDMKALQEHTRGLYKKAALQRFDILMKNDSPYPEIPERELRRYMKGANIETLKELTGSRETNAALEKEIEKIMEPHIPRVDMAAARLLYQEMVSKESDIPRLQAHVMAIDRHLERVRMADPNGRHALDPDKPLAKNEALLAPYRSAGDNLPLGHARRIYRELKNGEMPKHLMEGRIADMKLYLRLARNLDGVEPWLDPQGKQTDDEMIDALPKPEEKNPAATLPDAVKQLALAAVGNTSKLRMPYANVGRERSGKAVG